MQRAYLAGLYEGEGCVWLCKDGPTRRVRVTLAMTEKVFIDFANEKLTGEGIKTSYSTQMNNSNGLGKKLQHRIDINSRDDVEKFFTIIPTTRLRKKYEEIKDEDTRMRKKS
ncbi:MAG: LAGLIDADG family homing endonuclease [Candidatus Aenigmarchaeota archaeon]|nr:LAGLIDADG family homing endonuclease [Candidatus Aenigmarchaeota archaeon]